MPQQLQVCRAPGKDWGGALLQLPLLLLQQLGKHAPLQIHLERAELLPPVQLPQQARVPLTEGHPSV
jgi:hypothetical protein